MENLSRLYEHFGHIEVSKFTVETMGTYATAQLVQTA